MKRTLWTLSILAALAVPCAAQEAGQLGAGVELGAPTGGTAKYWVRPTQAVDAGIGYNGNLTLHGDYLWHAWDIFPQPREGRLGGYAGLGGRLRNREDDDLEFGLRTPAGVSYFAARHPIELFAEIAPVFKLNARNALDLDGVVGLRFYFTPTRARR